MAVQSATQLLVQKLYVAFYQRPADPAGLTYWGQLIEAAGGDATETIKAFANSAESQTLYGAITETTIGDVIDEVYMALFGVAPDAAGKQFYVDGFKAGTFNAGTLALDILNGAQNGDKVAIDNKLQVANSFTQQVDGRALNDANFGQGTDFAVTYAGDADAVTARNLLKTVTSSPATVLDDAGVKTALQTTIADAGDAILPPVGPVVGQTFTLTKGIDDFNTTNGKATAADDTYIAAIEAGAVESNTLNTGDVIDGGAGNDTLTITRASDNWPTVTVKNIETVTVRNTATVANPVDLAVFDSALVNVQSVNSAAATTFNNVNKAQELTVKDISATGLATTFNYKSGDLSGTSDSVKLNLNNVAAGAAADVHTVTLAGFAGSTQGVENLTVDVSGGAAQLVALTVNTGAGVSSLRKLTVTGDKNLAVTAAIDFAGAGTGEVDASAAKGNVSLSLANDDAVTVKGGEGNDSFTFGAGLTSADSIDGGAGKDTLGANTFADLQSAFAANRVTNVEVLRVQTAINATGTLDVSRAGNISEVVLDSVTVGNVATFDKLASNATFTIRSASAGTVTTNLKDATLAGTANTLDLNLGTGADAAGINAGTVTAAGVETINVTVAGTGGQASVNNLAITGNADLQKVVVKGPEAFTLNFAGGNAALREYDASTATGIQNTNGIDFAATGAVIKGGNRNDVLVGDGGNDSIEGGVGDDQITGANGSDVLTGGDGRDTFFASENGNVLDNLTNPITDTIKDFALGSGGDILNIAGLNNRPVADGALSAVKVTALNGALPATGGTDGRAELVILDSSVADLQAANASALNTKLFNLASAGYGNVVIAYSDSATGHTRLASATIVGGDVNNVRDFAILEGVTTAALSAGFHANNLAGLAAGTNYAAAGALNANLTTGAFADAGNATYTTLAALSAAGFGTITRGGFTLALDASADNAGVTYNATTGAVTNADGASANVINYVDATAFTGSGFADSVTISATNVNGRAYNAAAGTDTLTVSGALTGAYTLNLGTGASQVGGVGTSTYTNFENVDTSAVTGNTVGVTGVADSANFVTGATATTYTLVDGTGAAAVAINATAMANNTNVVITGGHGTDTVTVNGLSGNLDAGTAANDLLSNLVVNLVDNTTDDTITVATGSIATTVQGGIAGDTVTVDAAELDDNALLTLRGASHYTVTGLVGDLNTTGLTGTANLNVTAAAVAGGLTVTTANVAGTRTINANALTDGQVLTLAGAGNTTVSLNGGDLTSTSTGNITVDVGAGANTNSITLAGGDDVVNYATADTLTNGDTVNAGANGVTGDTLNVMTFAANATTALDGVSNFETINVTDANGTSLTLGAGVAAVGQVVAINYLTAGQAFTLNASGVAGRVNVTGNTGADILTGGALADTLSGGDGIDVLTGGAGADSLVGGAGNDVLNYASANESTGATADTINGFDFNADVIRLATTMTGTTFNATAGATGTMGFNQFNAATNTITVETNQGNLQVNLVSAANAPGGTGSLSGTAAIQYNVTGTAGNDTITTGSGNDTITGGIGRDVLRGGNGADEFVFAAGVTDTVATATSIAGVDLLSDLTLNAALADKINLTVTVGNVNTAVTGSLAEGTFVANMNTLLNTGGGAGFNSLVNNDISAAIVTANAGDLNGRTFLAVDLDGSDTFTATDFVIEITGSVVTSLTTGTFN